jgi:large subunit ribosomal protein L28
MEEIEMSKICQVTGKKTTSGNNVSHANNRTRRKFFPNLHTHRIWVESQNKFVKLRITKKGLRTIDKLGIDHVLSNLKEYGVRG